MRKIIQLFALLFLGSCTTIPEKELSQMKSPVVIVGIGKTNGSHQCDALTVRDSIGIIRTYTGSMASAISQSRCVGDTIK